MNKTKPRSALYGLLIFCVFTVFVQAAVPFPGPSIAATSIQTTSDQFIVGNNTLTATFKRTASSLRLAALRSPLNGLDLAWSDPQLFTIYLTGNDQPLTSSTMKLVGQPEVIIQSGKPEAARLSQRLPGRILRAIFSDEVSGLVVVWEATMTNGANYIRQEIRLSAARKPVNVDRIEMIRSKVPGAKVTGYTDGATITTDKLFLGIEHPMAKNEASDQAICTLPRQFELQTGKTWVVSTGIGVYPSGQQRRAFLYYLERERAHPYRQYWHYNSWFDLNVISSGNPDPLKRMTEAQCLEVIKAFGSELYEKRGVGLNGFVWDDGWDDWNSLWQFHPGFPEGFTQLKQAAAKQGAGMGAWLSPWGGYNAAKKMRLKYGRAAGYETNEKGFSLGGKNYYDAFREACLKMIQNYNQNYFKFDGIGGGPRATGAPASIATDLDSLVRLVGELRQASPNIFINCTVGTWASPYWTFFADSIWRQGDDVGFRGKGNERERWINYRDSTVYSRFASNSPLFPVNSLMYHGVVVGPTAQPGKMPSPTQDFDSFRNEIRMAAAYSSGLGELYITPALMSPAAWDELAECIRWCRANEERGVDSHWIGGDPGKNEIYGFAAWHPNLGGVLTLRNPDDKPQTYTLKLADAFELPAGAPTHYKLRSPWRSDSSLAIREADTLTPISFTLQAFEVITLETLP
jgi:hypothetical protein